MKKEFDEEEEMRRERWAQRKREMKRQKKRQELIRKISKIAVPVFVVLIVFVVLFLRVRHGKNPENEVAQTTGQETVTDVDNVNADIKVNADINTDRDMETRMPESGDAENQNDDIRDEEQEPEDDKETRTYGYTVTEDTMQLGGSIDSSYAILVDREQNTILARKAETSRIVPASMTKVLTLLVAVENIDAGHLDDKFEITTEITDYGYVRGCTVAGFEQGETVTVRDMLYGTILPSGADGALGLAFYVSGSHEAFVELMNKKLEELGLSDTAHFTNCVGVYDDNHYCTAYDMAVIMQAAVENETCREVLSAHTYTTSETEQHPEGLLLSNWFLRRIEDKDSGGNVVCGKSGYVVQSKNCAVSYCVDKKGREYICVTAGASGLWKCIYDHVNIYKEFSERS